MASGGARQGTPGRRYPNRTDMQKPKVVPITAATGQGYGVAKQQTDAQRALPISAPTPAPLQPGGAGPGQSGVPGLPPPPNLTAPTARPNEPVTAGVDVGPGPGSSALTLGDDPALNRLRQIYASYPSEDLREIIEELEGGGR